MKRAAVTGSEGFVGRHVRAALSARGVEVIGIGRPGSGAEIEVDLAARDLDVPDLVRRAGADATIWLAATIHRGSSVGAAARENLEVVATRPAEWILASPAGAPFAYASSIKVHRPLTTAPIDPAAPATRPDPWSYGSAKLFAERLLPLTAAARAAPLSIVRLAYVFGPGQHVDDAIPRFLREAWAGRPPSIFGEGRELRDDVYVTDVAHALVEACARGARGTFHAASGRPLTLLETAIGCCEAVEAAGGPAGLRPRLDPDRAPKPWVDRAFDVEGARRELDHRPTPLAAGLLAEARWIAAGARPEEATRFAPPHGARP